ncbi:MAG: hypothetical protein JWO92_1061 [Chitinophagaceae bacterium]|nr:hypothetical protein [Chitinophagaceae bacterium]
MPKKTLDAHSVIQELISRLGGNYSIKFAISDNFQQRIIVRNWITGEEKLNVPIFREVNDPFDITEINEKILETFLNM